MFTVQSFSKYNLLQSAYKQYHSSETALLKILDDVYTSVDGKRITILVSLDLSAAFDTMHHLTLLTRLKHTFGVSGASLRWITTYLKDRSQFVKLDDASSEVFGSSVGVPQGSVLGPLLFSLFVAPVSTVVSAFGVSVHQYADDTQLYIGIDPRSIENVLPLVNNCTASLQEWFLLNGLCLNPAKSESMVLGTGAQLKKVESITTITVAENAIGLSHELKSLGVILDERLSFDAHVNNICKNAHFHIRALRHIRQSISKEAAKMVACSIVSSRLDYCNSLLQGTSEKKHQQIAESTEFSS